MTECKNNIVWMKIFFIMGGSCDQSHSKKTKQNFLNLFAYQSCKSLCWYPKLLSSCPSPLMRGVFPETWPTCWIHPWCELGWRSSYDQSWKQIDWFTKYCNPNPHFNPPQGYEVWTRKWTLFLLPTCSRQIVVNVSRLL